MKYSTTELTQKVQSGDLRALARLLTLVENRVPRAREVQKELFKNTGNAHVVGVTGSPGAGKSTLVDQLAEDWTKQGKKVAILAVDPTSPFSGGAILGDRIRMVNSVEHNDVFIRSMATRGALGGISRATIEAVQVLDAAGFDYILVETVGVGQAEVDIVRTADTCFVVVVPGMGDSVQAIKAGILEIADLFIINKADRDGADLLHKDLRILLSLTEFGKGDWKPPIVKTVATKGEGVSEVTEHMQKHQSWYQGSTKGRSRKEQIIRDNIYKLANEIVLEEVEAKSSGKIDKLVSRVYERKLDPFSAAQELIKSKG